MIQICSREQSAVKIMIQTGIHSSAVKFWSRENHSWCYCHWPNSATMFSVSDPDFPVGETWNHGSRRYRVCPLWEQHWRKALSGLQGWVLQTGRETSFRTLSAVSWKTKSWGTHGLISNRPNHANRPFWQIELVNWPNSYIASHNLHSWLKSD